MNEFLKDDDLSDMPPNLGDEAVRQRLTPAGLKFFYRMMRTWQVPEDRALQLLALAPGTNLADLDPTGFSEEQLLRISCLVGIHKALHILYRAALADRWVRTPNTNVMFVGQTPLAYMASNGINGLRNVRKLLDARCAGNF